IPSLSRSPSACVFLIRSDPARSTKCNLTVNVPPVFSPSISVIFGRNKKHRVRMA
ncbi:unnamed protein product, partial [Schistosoma guineensis]